MSGETQIPISEAAGQEPLAGEAGGPARTPRKPRHGDELELRIERIDARGRARGQVELASGSFQVALRRGVPGSRVRARVVRRRGERVEAEALAVLAPGPDAVAPACRHFGTCGGCSFQDLAYPAQLDFKRAMVQAALAERGFDVPVEPCLAGSATWRYRNKMEFGFGRRWVDSAEPAGAPADFALGLHPAGQFRKVFDLLECPLQTDAMTAVVQSARRLALEAGLEPWNPREHTGSLRHLVLRRSSATAELMVVLVTGAEDPGRVGPYARALLAAHPEITTLVQAINARPAQVAAGERELVLHGPGHITERVGGLDFRLSPRSFFQTSTSGAEALVRVVSEEAACRPGDTVFDLYCGTGLLGLSLASSAGAVFGCELVEPAVADARANAARNGIANASFAVGDVAALLAAPPSGAAPQVVVIDPPRAGLHPSVPRVLAELVPRRLVYVSCNHRAAAADLQVLTSAGLVLRRARPLDLFPHTPHLECVFTLERAEGAEGPRPGPEPAPPAGAAGAAGADRGGLCPRCPHVRAVTSDRGSLFLRCELSRSDPRFPRYPAQPRLSCSGYPG